MHRDENKTRKDPSETDDQAKEAMVAVTLELMRFPNIRKLKTSRLNALSGGILAALSAKGFLTISNIPVPDEPEPAPERKLREGEGDPKRG